jgi:hypothetical protein
LLLDRALPGAAAIAGRLGGAGHRREAESGEESKRRFAHESPPAGLMRVQFGGCLSQNFVGKVRRLSQTFATVPFGIS